MGSTTANVSLVAVVGAAALAAGLVGSHALSTGTTDNSSQTLFVVPSPSAVADVPANGLRPGDPIGTLRWSDYQWAVPAKGVRPIVTRDQALSTFQTFSYVPAATSLRPLLTYYSDTSIEITRKLAWVFDLSGRTTNRYGPGDQNGAGCRIVSVIDAETAAFLTQFTTC